MVNNDDKLVELATAFLNLQEQRAITYNKFETGLKTYLNTAPNYDFASYRQVVEEVTQKFLDISKGIISIKEDLYENGGKNFGDLIRAIQESEEKKLNLTVEHHLARQMVLDSNGGPLEAQTERDIRSKLGTLIEDINDNLTEIRFSLADE